MYMTLYIVFMFLQEEFELAQRKFLQLLVKWTDQTETFPRLVLVDFPDLPPQDIPDARPTLAQKPAMKRRDTSAHVDREPLRDARPLHFRILCEHEAGWHTCSDSLPPASKLESDVIALCAPYIARVTALLRNSNHVQLNCASGEDGERFVSWIDQMIVSLFRVSTVHVHVSAEKLLLIYFRYISQQPNVDKSDFREAYFELRKEAMKSDSEKTFGGLVRLVTFYK